jgi:uncharacterized protein YkwD
MAVTRPGFVLALLAAWAGLSAAATSALEIVPEGEPAAGYGDPMPIPDDPVLAQAARAVREAAARAGKRPPVADGRLYAFARDMARFPGEGRPPYEAVEFALTHHGIVEPTPHVYLFEALGAESAAGIVAHLRSELPEVFAVASPARFGVAVEPTRPGVSSVALVLHDSFVELDRVPRELPRAGRFRLRARLRAPFREAELHLVGTDGSMRKMPLPAAGADIVCGPSVGKLKVEILGRAPGSGERVLANFPVWCGVAAPRRLALGAPGAAPTDAAGAEGELLALANRSRAEAGLAPLLPDERAAAVARAHSAEMRDGGWVAHVSPTTGGMEDRARRARLATPLLLENLARAYSAREAHEGLMNSPGHRANLLHPDATHLGVGVALREGPGGPELYVTQLFLRKNPRLDLAATRAALVGALAAARARAGASAAEPDPDLDRVAAAYARGLAAGVDRAKLGAEMDEQLDAIVHRYRGVMTVTGVTTDPVSAVRGDALDPGARFFGIGLAQGDHPEMGEGAVFVVILMGRPR